MKQWLTLNSMPTAVVATHVPHRLKLLALTAAMTFMVSGCGMTALKQRETLLSQQQQQLKEQQQKLSNEQQQLQKGETRLKVLEATLNQEGKRLKVLKKSLNSQSSNTDEPTNNSLVIVGEREHVYLSPPGVRLSARIDTGAKTSSLNALDLTEFERDGKPYARFNIIDPANGEKIEIIRRIQGHVKIKEHLGTAQLRPIIKIRVRLGSLDQHIEMTLADRSEFKNQVLIGRNFLRDFAIVDVSKKFFSETSLDSSKAETN